LTSFTDADLSGLDTDALVTAAKEIEQLRSAAPRITGRAAAELHRRGLSWPEISRLTRIPQTTIYHRAEPFLPE
jgi:hypothetical protein